MGLPALQQEVADEELQALPQQAQRGAVGHPEEEGTRVSDQPAPVSALGTPKQGTYLVSIWSEFSSKNLISYLSKIIFCLLLGKSHVPQINVQDIIKIKTEKLHVSTTNLLLQNNTGENNFSPLSHVLSRELGTNLPKIKPRSSTSVSMSSVCNTFRKKWTLGLSNSLNSTT